MSHLKATLCIVVLLFSGCDESEPGDPPTLEWELERYELKMDTHVPTHFVLGGMLPTGDRTLWFEIADDATVTTDAETQYNPTGGEFEVRIYCQRVGMTTTTVIYGEPGGETVEATAEVGCTGV